MLEAGSRFTSQNYRAPCHHQDRDRLRCRVGLLARQRAVFVLAAWTCHVDCSPRSAGWWEHTVVVIGAILAAPYIKPACASWHGSDRARSASKGCSTRTDTQSVRCRTLA